MKFSEKLKQAMQQLGINQAQVVGLTGKSKGSISMYLNDKTTPSEQVQSDIAVSLGLNPDYFEQEETPVTFKPSKCEDGIPTLTGLVHITHHPTRQRSLTVEHQSILMNTAMNLGNWMHLNHRSSLI